jgi:hypothetical protein
MRSVVIVGCGPSNAHVISCHAAFIFPLFLSSYLRTFSFLTFQIVFLSYTQIPLSCIFFGASVRGLPLDKT